jgi:hypothetical protein
VIGEMPDLTAGQFHAVLMAEVIGLDGSVARIYDRHRIAPVRVMQRYLQDGRDVGLPVWVVARSGETVMGYDEVEEEWGMGTARHGLLFEDATVHEWATCGHRLSWTVLRYAEQAGLVARPEPPPWRKPVTCPVAGLPSGPRAG